MTAEEATGQGSGAGRQADPLMASFNLSYNYIDVDPASKCRILPGSSPCSHSGSNRRTLLLLLPIPKSPETR